MEVRNGSYIWITWITLNRDINEWRGCAGVRGMAAGLGGAYWKKYYFQVAVF